MTQPSLSSEPNDPTIPIETIPDADEQLQVLRLLENGEITADEADQLLDAIDAEPSAGPSPAAGSPAAGDGPARQPNPQAAPPAGQRQPQLRIRVSDTDTAKARVNLTIPLGFLDAGFRLARRIVPGRIPEVDSVHSAMREGFRGHLIDVVEGNEHVEILVE